MKNPTIPKATKAETPTAPLMNSSGLMNEQIENRKKKGIFSTLMGSNSPYGNRLQNYLSSANNTNTAYNNTTAPTTRNRSGISVKD